MTTLAQLTTQIQDYTENRETRFVATIPTFIRHAEQRILNTGDLPNVRKTATRTVVLGTQYVGLPTDFISAFSVSVQPTGGMAHYLIHKDINFIREAYPSAAIQGLPEIYAQYDDANMMIGPAPEQSYVFTLNYFAKPASLIDAPVDTETWLSKNFSSALLYASLVNAYVFMKGEEDVITQYEKAFGEQMQLLDNVATNRTRKDAYRSGQKRTEGGQ